MLDDSDDDFAARPPAAPGPVKRSREDLPGPREGLVDLDQNQGWRDLRRPGTPTGGAELDSRQWGNFHFQKVYK
jgi:hypothetical protein